MAALVAAPQRTPSSLDPSNPTWDIVRAAPAWQVCPCHLFPTFKDVQCLSVVILSLLQVNIWQPFNAIFIVMSM